MEYGISPGDQSLGPRCPKRKDHRSFRSNRVWMAFLVQAPITNLFLVLNFTASASYAARSDLWALEIGYSGDFPVFLPAAIVLKKPTTRCRIRNDEGDYFRSLSLMSLVDWDAISGDG